MKKKLFSILAMIVVAILLTPSFTSCGKNEDINAYYIQPINGNSNFTSNLYFQIALGAILKGDDGIAIHKSATKRNAEKWLDEVYNDVINDETLKGVTIGETTFDLALFDFSSDDETPVKTRRVVMGND